VAGIIAPVALFSVNSAGALYTPPVKVPVPVKVTVCGVELFEQNGLA
jgi:hypothetical protein